MVSGRRFYYSMPTRYVFGRGCLSQLAENVPPAERVLFVHGRSAVHKLGIGESVLRALDGLGAAWAEVDYCRSDPDGELIERISGECQRFRPDLILAAGGGSTIDAAKAASLLFAARRSGRADLTFHDMLGALKDLDDAVPVGVILTLPASGSECNNSFVVRDGVGGPKVARAHVLAAPRFAICDPCVMGSLSDYQLACACADIMAHLLEQLFCAQGHIDHIDRMIYSCISSLIDDWDMLSIREMREQAEDDIMALGSLSLSYLFSTGRRCDWVAHEIDHRVGGRFGVPHGHMMAAIMPSWIRIASSNEYYRLRLDGFGTYCAWSMANGANGMETIARFFDGLGLPVDGVSAQVSPIAGELAEAVIAGGPLGRCVPLNWETCAAVFRGIGG